MAMLINNTSASKKSKIFLGSLIVTGKIQQKSIPKVDTFDEIVRDV